MWYNGEWHDGIWFGGIWIDGKWYGGRWKGGYDRKGNYHPEGDSPNKWEKSASRKIGNDEGLNFSDMMNKIKRLDDKSKKILRVVYGTATGLWYLIDKNDRDYYVWGIPIDEFIKFRSEDEAIAYATMPRRL